MSVVPGVLPDVVVTKFMMDPAEWGLYAMCYMQVCAYGEVSEEQVEERANTLNPPGTTGRWKITAEGPEGSDLLPIQCQDNPARIHYMLSC